MADRGNGRKIRFRPTIFGMATLLLPLLFLLPDGLASTPPAVLILSLGLPALVAVSFLLFLSALPLLWSFSSKQDAAGDALPDISIIGEEQIIQVDPRRPLFLPGLRLSACWTLKFGPFRRTVTVALDGKGLREGSYTFVRRGKWQGYYSLRACDPFGFFILDLCYSGSHQVMVPPVEGIQSGNAVSGRKVSDSNIAPRPKEDAEELLERRDYRPGDDPRRLDWKQLARTGDLMIRVGDDSVPLKGRLWLTVCSTLFRPDGKLSMELLDRSLEVAFPLIRRLKESGLEVLLRLPGEKEWATVASERLTNRLASALPAVSEHDWPAAGEHLWIISHPLDTHSRSLAEDARKKGCRVVLAFPAVPDGQMRWPEQLFRRIRRFLLIQADRRAEEAGIDVRHI